MQNCKCSMKLQNSKLVKVSHGQSRYLYALLYNYCKLQCRSLKTRPDPVSTFTYIIIIKTNTVTKFHEDLKCKDELKCTGCWFSLTEQLTSLMQNEESTDSIT